MRPLIIFTLGCLLGAMVAPNTATLVAHTPGADFVRQGVLQSIHFVPSTREGYYITTFDFEGDQDDIGFQFDDVEFWVTW